MHLMVQRLGLVEDIDDHLHLLKVHLPYHESDHVLNIAYNILAGGVRIGRHRTAAPGRESFSTAWTPNGFRTRPPPEISRGGSAPRISLTLAGMHQSTRQAVWKMQPEGFLEEAFIDVDGTIAGTYGECKEGIGHVL